MNIAICTTGVFNPPLKDHQDYLTVTNHLKAYYCKKYGYAFMFSDKNPHEGRDPHFSKFQILLSALEQGFDYAVWMDCDAAPVNMNANLGEMLASMPREKVVIGKDINGWNSGVFAVPNCDRSRSWLLSLDSEDTHNNFKDMPFWDQDAITASFQHEAFNDFAVTPPADFGFNDYEPIYKCYTKAIPNEYRHGKSWVLHIPGYGDVYRKARFERELHHATGEECPICGCLTKKYFTVPMDKTFLPVQEDIAKIGGDCDYHICPNCDFIYAPAFRQWTNDDFREKIYNADYEKYIDIAHGDGSRDKMLLDMWGKKIAYKQERILDYGGGHGGFARGLEKEFQIWADSYDKFYDNEKPLNPNFKYSLVTCFEVLEHVFDPKPLFSMFNKTLVPGGTLITSTQRWDNNKYLFGQTPDKWQNIAPRNGHVCMYSTKAFRHLASVYGFAYVEDMSGELYQLFKKLREIS